MTDSELVQIGAKIRDALNLSRNGEPKDGVQEEMLVSAITAALKEYDRIKEKGK